MNHSQQNAGVPPQRTGVGGSLSAGGRRIYIHAYSLRCLARKSEEVATSVSTALTRIRVAKVFHHHVEMGVDIGLVRPHVGERFAVAFEWVTELTGFFRTVGHRPCFPADRSSFLPLLGAEEEIVATCSEQGYYTFATDLGASARMFADHEPFPVLQRGLSSKTGPDDLTMIRGVSLSLIDPAIGTGPVGYRYGRELKCYALSEPEVDEIDRLIRTRSLEETRADVAAMSPGLTEDEARVCRDMLASVERTFARAESL